MSASIECLTKQGGWFGKYLREAICETVNETEKCLENEAYQIKRENGGTSFGVIALIILSILLTSVFVVFCYKRIVIRNLDFILHEKIQKSAESSVNYAKL